MPINSQNSKTFSLCTENLENNLVLKFYLEKDSQKIFLEIKIPPKIVRTIEGKLPCEIFCFKNVKLDENNLLMILKLICNLPDKNKTESYPTNIDLNIIMLML